MAADETITVNFAGLSQAVGVIVLMASISSAGGSFQQVESATVNITTQNPPSQQYLPLGSHGNKSSLILGLLFRKYTETGPVWVFRQIEAATNGRNFDECKQMMQVYVDLTIGSEMVAERGSLRTDKKFVMHKDDAVTIPANMAQLHIGLGWTDIVDDSLDLDASVIMVDAKKSKVRTVYYGNKNGPGVKHQGDNTTGQGAGDDEVILINLNQVPANVHHLFFTVNVYAGGSFRDIRDSFIRLCLQDRQKTEVARYPLEPNISSRGVIFGCMTREGNAWFFKALGEQCGGQTADQIRCAHWS